jgi:hypothetical protein
VSLSSDPAFSLLKKYFVCGYRDITYEPYAGVSGRHEVGGNAVDTTNGAGPHNLQLFILASDGTVLSVLPGYWHSQDLVPEMNLAAQLDKVWTDNTLSRTQKDQIFRNMQLNHIATHSPGMVKRSKMQSFDMQYEAQNRLATSDTILDRSAASFAVETHNKIPPNAFKTTDRLMHERMAVRPFLSYNQFDTAAFAEYGKTKYDKHEDYRMADGKVNKDMAKAAPLLGNPQTLEAQRPKGRRRMMMMQQQQQQSSQQSGWGTGRSWGNNGT